MEDLKEYKKIQYSNFEYEDEKYIEDGKKFLEEFKKNNPNAVNIKLTYEAIDNDPQTIDNPLTNTPAKSTFMLNSKKPEYYIRFGYLLDYIKKNILPRVKVGEDHDANPPIFKIDTDPWDNYMYSLPNQISLDPRVCIVRNSNFISGRGTVKVFHELWVFRPVDGKNSKSKNYNVAYPMNIYLNFNFVLESLQLDDRGDVNLFEFISNICTGLNKSLGGINNLEPIIDESSNTLKIIDTTPIPGLSENSSASSYMLQLYGYDKIGSNYIANFIRKVDLKTAITPEYATMITVGATAGGYVKGTEATAFSKWNVGLRDRFKEDFTPGNIESVKPDNGIDEAESNYVNRFLSGGYTSRYGFSDLPPHSFSLVDDIIEGNISIVTEYYKYLLSKEKSTSGGTIGFIPFKLSMTMDGLSGIKIYNKLNVNTEFLPKAYGKNMDLIITGVSHKLSNNDWETDLETTVIPKSGALSVVEIPPASLQESIDKVDKITKGKVPESRQNVITKIVELAKSKGITDKERLTCILAVAGGETQWNPSRSESFSYSLARARQVFGSRIPKKDEIALKYIPASKGGSGSQETLANLLYGKRYGNGPNEGWKYRGRGMTQITFKGNYENVQENLISKYFPNKGNIVTNPDLVNNVDVSVAILVYGKIYGFFGDRLVKNDKAYLSDPVRVQATQNGSNGKGSRKANSVTKNYANAIYAINNTPWVQKLIS
jgi:predicted chitinase